MVQRLSHTFDRALTLVGLVVVLAGCVSEQQTPYPRTPAPVPPTTQTRPPQPQYPATDATCAAADSANAGTGSASATAGRSRSRPSRLRCRTKHNAPRPRVTCRRRFRFSSARSAFSPTARQLWIELARCHLKEGNTAQAEQFARKALLFTGNRYDLEQQAWVVIADARAQKQ